MGKFWLQGTPWTVCCLHFIWHRAATMIDSNSSKQIVLPSGAECRARLLFSPLCDKMYSIDEPFELIKAYENKSIWGYRHPAVMNIGAGKNQLPRSQINKPWICLKFSKVIQFRESCSNLKVRSQAKVALNSLMAYPNQRRPKKPSLTILIFQITMLTWSHGCMHIF